MATRYDLWCSDCKLQEEVTGPFGVVPHRPCQSCGKPLVRYFGGGSAPLVNYGFREHRYATQTDADIAKWQFTNA